MDETLVTKRERLRSRLCSVGRWLTRNFGQTAAAPYGAGLLVAAVIAGVSVADTYWPEVVGFVVCILGALVLLWAAGWVAEKVCRVLLKRSIRPLLSLALLIGSLYWMIRRGAGEGATFRVALVSAGMALALYLFSTALCSLFRWRRITVTTLLAGLFSGTLTVLSAVFLFTNGFDDHYIQRYLAMGWNKDAQVEAFESYLGPGPYTAVALDYGTEEGLASETVSISAFAIREGADLNGAYAELYLDYDLSEVPLVGRVWYPAEGENCPVLFIAHGNHTIAVDSYLGYDYLGEYLASHGYVVVSVDQNACNLLNGENDARAVLLLEHIDQVLSYSEEPGNPLYGRIDGENIAIAGHSRGGEMVATAYLFNGYDRYPENGTIRFDYHFNIKSLIALAPTVNQYKPADHSVELEDVNYLLLHGACDRDVTNFMGMAQYENISFTGEGDYLKSALYIAGANHGQFNSLWGAYDQPAPFSALLNAESLLSAADQQKIACLFIKAFLDVTLLGNEDCRTLLTDWDSYAAQLPKTVYMQCYETSGFVPIADFEEDSDLETATAEGVSASASGVQRWTEELMNFANSSSYDTHALRLKWGGSRASYTLRLPETDAMGWTLSFDIADLDDEAVEGGDYQLVDAEILLIDSGGRTASAQLSDFATVYPVLPVRTDKLDFLFGESTYRHAFSTVSIPVDAFAAEEGFDSSSIVELTFRLAEGGGEVAMDNIGWIAEA